MRRRRNYAGLTDGNLVDRTGAAAEQARRSDAPMIHQERGCSLAAQQPDLVVDPEAAAMPPGRCEFPLRLLGLTFTALTCIDWLSAGLCRISTRTLTEGVYRDRLGRIRLIESDPSYPRMVNRATDKIRQASRGMPAVVIRLMDSLARVVEYTTSSEQRAVLRRQAEMVLRAAEEDISEPNDLAQVRERFELLVTVSEVREAEFTPAL